MSRYSNVGISSKGSEDMANEMTKIAFLLTPLSFKAMNNRMKLTRLKH